MATLKNLIREMTEVEGINAAVVVNRDGFMIEGVMKSSQIDMEYMAAIISAGIGSSEQIARQLELGELHTTMVECNKGVVVIVLLGDDAIMAVVADLKANLGNIRYQLKKRVQDIKDAL